MLNSEVKQYCCPYCKKELRFVQEALFIQLEEDPVGEDAGLYECKSCDKEYYKKMYLNEE